MVSRIPARYAVAGFQNKRRITWRIINENKVNQGGENSGKN